MKFLLPIPATLGSAGQEVSVPKRGTLPLGDTAMVYLNWQLSLPPGYLELLMPVNQQPKKELLYWLEWLNDPDCQGVPTKQRKKGVYLECRRYTGHLLLLPGPVIQINRQQDNTRRTADGSDPSGMKIWVTPPCKEPWPARCFTEGRGIGSGRREL